jgi:hypothetical protein
MTYREIGANLGVSTGRAVQLFKEAKRAEECGQLDVDKVWRQRQQSAAPIPVRPHLTLIDGEWVDDPDGSLLAEMKRRRKLTTTEAAV